MQEHDVVGIGNAIVDIIGRCDEAFLARHGCAKGSMQLVDAAAVAKLYDAMGPAVEISGGSGANTIVGVASFGGRAGFIGKTADDQFGQVFGHDIRTAGVTFTTPPAAEGSEPTGRCLVLVTPDGQRTMNTFLGVSPQLGGGEVDAELIAPRASSISRAICSTGPRPRPRSGRPREIAAKAGRQVALSLSGCLLRRPASGRVPRADPRQRRHPVRQRGRDHLALSDELVRRGRAGARRPTPSSRRSRARRRAASSWARASRSPFPPRRWPKVVDTTGAGDLYAAGFLFGVATGRDLETAGRLGSLAAAEIISHIGARPAANALHGAGAQNGLLVSV